MPQDFRYRRLGYVALNVSDVERSGDFYRDFVGLTPAGQALNGEHLFRCSERHHDVVLHQSDAVGLRRVGWEMESAKDVARIRAHLQSLDIEPHPVAAAECDALGVSPTRSGSPNQIPARRSSTFIRCAKPHPSSFQALPKLHASDTSYCSRRITRRPSSSFWNS